MEKVFVVRMVTERLCLHTKGCIVSELTKETKKQ